MATHTHFGFEYHGLVSQGAVGTAPEESVSLAAINAQHPRLDFPWRALFTSDIVYRFVFSDLFPVNSFYIIGLDFSELVLSDLTISIEGSTSPSFTSPISLITSEDFLRGSLDDARIELLRLRAQMHGFFTFSSEMLRSIEITFERPGGTGGGAVIGASHLRPCNTLTPVKDVDMNGFMTGVSRDKHGNVKRKYRIKTSRLLRPELEQLIDQWITPGWLADESNKAFIIPDPDDDDKFLGNELPGVFCELDPKTFNASFVPSADEFSKIDLPLIEV